MIGFHSDMIWLPEHGVGAVVLTNGDPGWLIRSGFRRKLLEVLFDGKPEADADLAAGAKTFFEQLAAERKLLTVPADRPTAAELAARYSNPALGEIARQPPGRGDGVRLRRVEERGGVAQEPRRHRRRSSRSRPASAASSSSSATSAEAHLIVARRAARVRVRRGVGRRGIGTGRWTG